MHVKWSSALYLGSWHWEAAAGHAVTHTQHCTILSAYQKPAGQIWSLISLGRSSLVLTGLRAGLEVGGCTLGAQGGMLLLGTRSGRWERQGLGAAAGRRREDQCLHEAWGQDNPCICLGAIQMHIGWCWEKTWKAFKQAAEAFALLFTTEQFRAIPTLRLLFMGNESAAKSALNWNQ